jgi:spermidine synthase
VKKEAPRVPEWAGSARGAPRSYPAEFTVGSSKTGTRAPRSYDRREMEIQLKKPALSAARRELFLASFLFLFFELVLIRWLPSQVLFLTFFTNTILLASFLGLSLGCMAASHKRGYLSATAVLLVVTIAAAVAMEWVRLSLQNIIDVGRNASSPQVVYFSTEVRLRDVASFVIPIELVAGLFFVLVAGSMVGIGQLLGSGFRTLPSAVEGYCINIGGSLAGVLLFSIFSWCLPPVWWFGVVAAGIAYFLIRSSPRRWWAVGVTICSPFLLLVPQHFAVGVIRQKYPAEFWSPYYRINYSPTNRTIVVNLIGQQTMSSRKDPFAAYAVPYLLNRDAGQPSFHDVLIIGAGSGNDVSRALEWIAPDAHVDAVEIDPVILSLGRSYHPDHPYQDARVTTHLNDGRNFLRATSKKYDLIVFALIDSLVLHSSVSNLRLESYLFTEESMADVRRRLKPDGLFVMYNYFRQGWIVSRLDKTLDRVFDCAPVVLSMPFQESIKADAKAEGFTMFLEGARADAVRKAFQAHGSYFVPTNRAPDPSLGNGFQGSPTADQVRFGPSRVEIPHDLRTAADAWPFLYLHNPMIPSLTWRGMAVIGVTSAVMLWAFGWRIGRGRFARSNGRMFLLGAGFMLLETKAVVHMALIFGSTWIVSTVVFTAVLVMILAANLMVLKGNSAAVGQYFVALLLLLVLNVAVPLEAFLGLPPAIQGLAAGVLVLSPIFCAGVIFARWFGGVAKPDQALAYNTAGAILGGILESASLLIGFQWLLAVACAIYVGAWALEGRKV